MEIPHDMDVPEMRRNLNDLGNVRWLLRNLFARNSNHPEFENLLAWCKLRIRNNDIPKWPTSRKGERIQ
jgi:hypothetical protein